MPDLKKIWSNRKQILEGLGNSILIRQEIENIANQREVICMSNECGSYDSIGEGCEIKGTQPCCSNLTGGCGCVISLKIRALSSECPKGYWPSIMSDQESDNLIPNDKI